MATRLLSMVIHRRSPLLCDVAVVPDRIVYQTHVGQKVCTLSIQVYTLRHGCSQSSRAKL